VDLDVTSLYGRGQVLRGGAHLDIFQVNGRKPAESRRTDAERVPGMVRLVGADAAVQDAAQDDIAQGEEQGAEEQGRAQEGDRADAQRLSGPLFRENPLRRRGITPTSSL